MFWPRKRPDTDFSAELASHIALEADRLQAEGLSEAEAYARARKAFGNIVQSEERFYESRRLKWLDHLRQDTVYAVRQLRKNKTFSVVAVATLALGIGAAISIFTLVSATLLKALPFRDAERVVSIKDFRLQGPSLEGLVGVPRFFDLQSRNRAFESLAFFYFDDVTMIWHGGTANASAPVPLAAVNASGDYWKTIGIHAAIGRTFDTTDDRRNAPDVVIISDAIWRRVFAADPTTLNQQVTIDGKPATIIGVLSPDLQYPAKIDIWRPAQFDPPKWTNRGNGSRFVNVLGRLKPSVSMAAAKLDLLRIGTELQRQYPDSDAIWEFTSESLRDYLYGALKPALLILLAASGMLLLIACINVANLLLSRATTRTREVALRRALGASQVRIILQFLTENTLLALSGGCLGLFAAYLLVNVLASRLPGRLGSAGVSVDWRIVLFTFTISVSTGILFGLLPLLQSSRIDLNSNLKRGDLRVGGPAGGGIRTVFISLEVALSLILLVGASLLFQSLRNLLERPLGFQPANVLTFKIEIPRSNDPRSRARFFDDFEHGIEAIPGVIAVGQITALPTVDWHLRSTFDVDWKPRTANMDAVNVENRHIWGNYLQAMHIPLLAGRAFNEHDTTSKTLVALVNQEFVRQYSPDANLLGRHLIGKIATFEIVGVIGDVRGTAGSIARPPGPEVYYLTEGDHISRSFAIRSQFPPERLTPVIREQLRRLDQTLAIQNVLTLDERISASVAQPRFNMGLLLSVAGVALLLACVGIYGVVSYSVAQRSVEIGIRMALGATRFQVTWMFLRRALLAAMIGLGVGGILALSATRLIESQLYGVSPADPLAFSVSVALLLAPVVLASLRAALQATRVNPVEALRSE